MRDALELGRNRLAQGRTESAHALLERMCQLGACAVARPLSGRLARHCRFLSFLHRMIDEFPHRRVGIDTLTGERSRGQGSASAMSTCPPEEFRKSTTGPLRTVLGIFKPAIRLGTFRVLRFFFMAHLRVCDLRP